MSPRYISNLVSIKSCSIYSLRSNSSLILDRPKRRILSTLGTHSLCAAALTLVQAALTWISQLLKHSVV